MTDSSLIEIIGAKKAFGGARVLESVDLRLDRGGRHALIGPNGAGKSTLLAIAAGELAPDAGTVTWKGRDITHLAPHKRARAGIARTFQTSEIFNALDIVDNLDLAIQRRDGTARKLTATGRRRHRDEAREILRRVDLERRMTVLASDLSHGERRQLEIGITLAMQPEAILLDEPMAGLSSAECDNIAELLETLEYPLGFIMVEHNFEAVNRLCSQVSLLHGGEIVFAGSPAEVAAAEVTRRVYL